MSTPKATKTSMARTAIPAPIQAGNRNHKPTIGAIRPPEHRRAVPLKEGRKVARDPTSSSEGNGEIGAIPSFTASTPLLGATAIMKGGPPTEPLNVAPGMSSVCYLRPRYRPIAMEESPAKKKIEKQNEDSLLENAESAGSATLSRTTTESTSILTRVNTATASAEPESENKVKADVDINFKAENETHCPPPIPVYANVTFQIENGTHHPSPILVDRCKEPTKTLSVNYSRQQKPTTSLGLRFRCRQTCRDAGELLRRSTRLASKVLSFAAYGAVSKTNIQAEYDAADRKSQKNARYHPRLGRQR